jgi:pyruvate kinase
MKTNSIVIAVLLLLAFVSAKSQEQAVNFWTPKTVVLYRGIENPLAINLCGLELKDLQITVSDGAQILIKEGKISVFVPIDFEKDELIITVEHQKGEFSDNTTINHLKVSDTF